jgi:hypothetical protein
MPTPSAADLRFCNLADRWKDCYGIIEDCRHFALSGQEQFRYRLLADSLLDEIRRRRPDLDVRSLATLSKLDFRNPPSDGELVLLVRDATDLIGETYHAILPGRVGEYIALTCPKLRTASPPPPWEVAQPAGAPASGTVTPAETPTNSSEALVHAVLCRVQEDPWVGNELAKHLDVPPSGLSASGDKMPEAPAELPDLVTLNQAAALVNRTSDGLRHYRTKGMPKPFIQGTKGKPNEYRLSEMWPWLEDTFNRKIPEVAIQKFRSSGK